MEVRLGGYYGARLADAGNDVVFIARGSQLVAIRENGLKVLSPVGDLHIKNAVATDQPKDAGEVDAVLLAVKTWQVPDVAVAMKPMLGPKTVVVPFLNGVEASDQCVEVLGSTPVLGGLSKVFSQIEQPGVVRHMNPHAFVEIGELTGIRSDRVMALVDVFVAAGIESVQSEDIRTSLWKKLMLVASWSGIGAASRTPLGSLLQEPGSRRLIEQSMDEVFAVGRAQGYQLPESLKREMWSFYEGLPADTSASMMRDILDGKPSELDAWIGSISRIGRDVGVETPIANTIYDLLLPIEKRARA